MHFLSFLLTALLIVTLANAQSVAPSPSNATNTTELTSLTPATAISDPPSSVPLQSESDIPSSAPTLAPESRACESQINVYQSCLNSTMSLEDVNNCDDCVAASFPDPTKGCPLFQSSICTALTRDCNCGECTADIETYIDCALVEAGRDECELECSYDTCDAVQFQFTSCMEESGFTVDGITACVDCTRNALNNGGPVSSCEEATDRVCPAIATDCGCGSCRAELQTYMGCDAVGKEIPSNCSLDCGLESVNGDQTDRTPAPADTETSGDVLISAISSMLLVGLSFML
ncbi:hypothetical protein MPSEU_000780900 [Mayamaea pseudoterrestris]|nr:hypothetical protein MPSEU_000780900 [Mayamaea pseudoterrestris]